MQGKARDERITTLAGLPFYSDPLIETTLSRQQVDDAVGRFYILYGTFPYLHTLKRLFYGLVRGEQDGTIELFADALTKIGRENRYIFNHPPLSAAFGTLASHFPGTGR